MKRNIILILLMVLLITFTSCGSSNIKQPSDNGKIKIITTLFPQYDFTKNIAKDKAEVVLLLPPGMEAHAYEPTPQDIASIKKADIFIYTGEAMEPWAHRIIDNLNSESLIIVDASKNIGLIDEEEHEHEEHEHEEHEHEEHTGGKDPHIWLDPVYAQQIVDNIVEGLVTADPLNENFYKENAEGYKEKLKELDLKFIKAFEKTQSKTIIYAGHFAFGYFAKRYGLSYISPYVGFTPDAEPTPKKIGELIDTINKTGLKAIYYEELIDPKVARVISKETGAKMYLLHGAHNIKKDELASGITYIQIMEENLEKLKQGLGYNE